MDNYQTVAVRLQTPAWSTRTAIGALDTYLSALEIGCNASYELSDAGSGVVGAVLRVPGEHAARAARGLGMFIAVVEKRCSADLLDFSVDGASVRPAAVAV